MKIICNMRKIWNLGSWKRDFVSGRKYIDLKIKDSNIAVGHAYVDYNNSSRTIVIGRLSNITGDKHVVYKDITLITDSELDQALEIAFASVQKRLLI